ncbi:hypothetical protein BW247_11730 [Acidihalobacter ferrooxydans]|uniref:DUF4124 domain-containing protein n=2 Tax=Acidihalobacter ferrooxydans TaxID=1765967 RepID=A0A1P8UIL4_9GAMM|nr:hypothetical protein BW247_11730 [Acidihalobacter ferrooxydans]
MGLGVCACLLATAVQAQEYYRWRDAHGVVHYASTIPGDAVADGYDVLNANGAVIKHVPPPPTPQQRAAAAAAARKQQAAEAARAAQQRLDSMLLLSFDSVRSIERLRDERVGALTEQLRHLRERQNRLEQQQRALLARKAELKPAQTARATSIRQELDGVDANLKSVHAAVRSLATDRAATIVRFDTYIKRFRQLQAAGRVPQ